MQQDKNIINVTSYQQTGGMTVGQINGLLKNEKSKKKSKWTKVIMVITMLASIVTILGYFGIKVNGGI